METILAGIFSGLVASFLFLIILRNFRPNIEIATQISYTTKDKKYNIKLINKGKRNIVDIRVELLMVSLKNVPGGAILETKPIELKKNSAFILSGYDKKDVDAKFARRFTTTEDLKKLWSNEDTQFLIFRVYCHDEVSGFGKVFTQEYRTKRNSILSGQYNFGDSLEIS